MSKKKTLDKFKQKLFDGVFIDQSYLMEETIQQNIMDQPASENENYLDKNLADKVEKEIMFVNLVMKFCQVEEV